jgi:hypothetical protein
MGAGKVVGKMRKRRPERTALGGMGNWDHHRQVCASKITLGRASRCSGRGYTWVGSHSNAIVYTGRCIVVLQPELLQMGSHKCIDPQQGHPL